MTPAAAGVIAALTLAAPIDARTPSPDGFYIAITVDDLPVHGKLPPGMTRTEIARAHVEILKRFGVAWVKRLGSSTPGGSTAGTWIRVGC